MKRTLVGFILLYLILGCAPKIDSPYSDKPTTSIRNYNQENIAKLNPSGEIFFAVLSDSHQNYEDLNKAIGLINQQPVSFVLNTGDFTNLGTNSEYDIFVDQIMQIKAPFITTIGNHDTLGKGVSLYRKIFGPDNYFFDYLNYRFILFNNNYLDMQYIDLDWLTKTINESPYPVIIVQHINISEADYYPNVYPDVLAAFNNPKITLVLCGHKHGFSDEITNNYLTHQTARTDNVQYSLIKITGGQINVQNCINTTCTDSTF